MKHSTLIYSIMYSSIRSNEKDLRDYMHCFKLFKDYLATCICSNLERPSRRLDACHPVLKTFKTIPFASSPPWINPRSSGTTPRRIKKSNRRRIIVRGSVELLLTSVLGRQHRLKIGVNVLISVQSASGSGGDIEESTPHCSIHDTHHHQSSIQH